MYEKQTWVDGDVLSASKLNHIEDGVEESNLPEVTTKNYGGYLGVIADEDNTTDVIVVPQQTVTLTNQQEAVIYDFSSVPQKYIWEQLTATIEVNGVQYSGQYNGSNQITIPTQDTPPYCWFFQTSSGWFFIAQDSLTQIESGTYTVKCTLHIPSAKWGITFDDDGGGGDISVS